MMNTREIKLKAIKVMLLSSMVLLASSSFAKEVVPTVAKDMQTRLQQLSEKLEKQRQAMNIPGMAIAVVKDDQVIMAKGFGLSDLENKTKVTPETLFAIGSSSKAFTATLVGMMVDEQKMSWDAPITEYLPYLQYQLANDEEVTIRDMLSHRSGFARNDLLWANGVVGRDKILRTSINAEPFSGYHEKFNYNNVMFLGAGVASAKVADTDWDSLLEERLLKPLGMNETSSRLAVTKQSPMLSQGYMWQDELQEHEHQTMKDLANIAPAGAINSNVLDMAKWLKFQLNNGEVNGKQLISQAALKETHSSQVSLAETIKYGMGWFLREWQGQPVIEHGGNIAGFGAQVAFLPESDLGFVLLTNVTATPLQQGSMNIVWETLLGEENETQDESPAVATNSHEQYFGDYIANFGPFKDTIFAVSDKDGVMHVNVPGQMNYALKEPNAEGKWLFAVTDTISVSFEKNAAGKVSAMRMQQGGMNFEIPRKGVPILPEIDPQQLQAYLGAYESGTFKGTIQAVIQNHRLAIDVPNQMVFELNLPNEQGERTFRIKSNMKALFETNDSEQVTALKIYSDDKLIDTAKRVVGEVEALPTVADILKLRKTEARKKAYAKAGDIQMHGTVNFVNSGLKGKVLASTKGKDSFLVNMDLGEFGFIRTAINQDGGSTDGIQQYQALVGKYLAQARQEHFASSIDWRDFYQDIKVVGSEDLDGQKTYVVNLKSDGLPTVTVYVDVETGDVVKRKTSQLVPMIGSIPMNFTFEDYREVKGMRIPFKTTVKNPMMGKLVMEQERIETNLDLNPEIFVIKDSE